MVSYGQVKGRRHPANQPSAVLEDKPEHGTIERWKLGCYCGKCADAFKCKCQRNHF
jgi:hypothetical protein